MIDWTDRYCRFFHRLLTRKARLYTEMVVDEAIIRGDRDRLLDPGSVAGPVALQLGGSDAGRLAEAARIGEGYGYQEVNFNVGCPSDRVQSGAFGACLMRDPSLVARGVEAMRRAVSVPVTVKCRIGVDDQDPAAVLPAFADAMAGAGCETLIVHARKAWLQGLSPKENRSVPPLDYELVAQLARERRDLHVVLNGGIGSLDEAEAHLGRFAGVMLGRAAYERPYLLTSVDERLFGENVPAPSRAMVVRTVADRAERTGTPVWRYARHMLGLYAGEPGARTWRRRLSEETRAGGSPVLLDALDEVEAAQAAA
ncbi:tRNA-dihydrouridine synthase A [Parvularcula dongshanensis]|uniref:tRNA-dihydrouridine(20/20a) synthase n=2 Tax=Parvularcula dongshanensis TaxID=1173995 RepID=A0A840I622_9PROT|nr:tRNA-dihydrouridine synthase A [Parvularcula dongshanensis]